MALVMVRLIQHAMGEGRLSAERIAEALREANCLLERGGHVCYNKPAFQDPNRQMGLGE